MAELVTYCLPIGNHGSNKGNSRNIDIVCKHGLLSIKMGFDFKFISRSLEQFSLSL